MAKSSNKQGKRRLIRLSPEKAEDAVLRKLGQRLESLGDKVTVLHLSDKTGLEPQKIRAIIRSLGMKAKKVGIRRQYVWDAQSKELRKIESALRRKLTS